MVSSAHFFTRAMAFFRRLNAYPAIRNVMAWGLSTAFAVGLYSILLESILLAQYQVPFYDIAICSLAAGAFSVLGATLFAPLLGLLTWIHRKNLGSNLWFRAVWVLSVASSSSLVAWHLVDPFRRRVQLGYFIIIALAGVGSALLAELSRLNPPRNRVMAALLVLGLTTGSDLYFPAMMYIELHDLFYILSVCALCVAVTPLKQRIERAGANVLLPAGLVLACSILSLSALDYLRPGWRTVSYSRGRVAVRTSMVVRKVIAFDPAGKGRIGTSERDTKFLPNDHPCATKQPGKQAADDQDNGQNAFGLTPPFGEPGLGSADVNLVIFVTIDTLREDAFSSELMPNFSALSKDGVRLMKHYAAGTRTNTSLPDVHRAYPSFPAVAELLERAGVVVTAVVEMVELDGKGGFGFLHIFQTDKWAVSVTDIAIERIMTVGETPHYVWLHYYAPHDYYSPVEMVMPATGSHLPVDYQKSVYFVDQEFGRLLRFLQRKGRLEKAVVIMTSDHGEAFGEHGVTYHSHSGIEEVMRVPGFVVAPGMAADRYEHLTTIRDMPPTILGSFGLTDRVSKAECFGRSLLRLRQPGEKLHDFVYVRSAKYVSGAETTGPMGVMINERYKLVYYFDEDLALLYDLDNDPKENEEIGLANQPIVSRMKERLKNYCALGGC